MNDIKKSFRTWLAESSAVKPNTAASYLRAIELLEGHFGKQVYGQNLQGLEELYRDLIENQQKEKYHIEGQSSYGNYFFYSASVISYMQFLKQHADGVEQSELNQIFFGPPGTGKTFHTISAAVSIVDPEFFVKNRNDRKAIRERFNSLLIKEGRESAGRIGFTTFHQSMSYEDFIEGIKPMQPAEGDTHLKYDVEDGIFKRLCQLAEDEVSEEPRRVGLDLAWDVFERAEFFKMSLGNTLESSEDEIYEYCIENGVISLGFGNGLDYTGMTETQIRSKGAAAQMGQYDITAMNLFVNYLRKESYVVVSSGNRYIRAIGKVTGDYKFVPDSPFPNHPTWKHFREVEWLYHGEKIPSAKVYNRNLSQMTIYKFDKREINREFFVESEERGEFSEVSNNYVLIIDEINRGNVSAIFGELITLIEPNKRAGADEALEVVLPYSKSNFSVPKNLYIIGTMNTADRSVEALDSALRRRFAFTEMAPKPEVIAEHGKLSEAEGVLKEDGLTVDLPKLLETINNRIELLRDKDCLIGHSYLMEVESLEDLRRAFKDKIIPLLQEYFFSDLGKLSLVLGSSFVELVPKEKVSFAKGHDYDGMLVSELKERKVYRLTKPGKWKFEQICDSEE